MNINQPTEGKILLHGTGSGGITEKNIERRAREIASINGRPPTAVTQKDLAQALRELTGQDLPPTTGEDTEARGAMTRDPSEPLSETGHQTADLGGPDEQKAIERLAEEGVEEAQHEQMLAARRRARREDK